MATRGRPIGAKSFVNIDMETLNGYFGSKQHIPVSRVWLEKMNIKVADVKPNVVQSSEQPTIDLAPIEFKITK
tara:strand:- start:535 stop:753 length:219 start_codon:yes stop_codon:yes gene_type:complete